MDAGMKGWEEALYARDEKEFRTLLGDLYEVKNAVCIRYRN
jgi:hypothetical protein